MNAAEKKLYEEPEVVLTQNSLTDTHTHTQVSNLYLFNITIELRVFTA